ncbi:MAG: Hsp20 family protein [Paludibacteraceae bacterium]|nr:Hsp20 family protein [Paludibacteraceae bacterium]
MSHNYMLDLFRAADALFPFNNVSGFDLIPSQFIKQNIELPNIPFDMKMTEDANTIKFVIAMPGKSSDDIGVSCVENGNGYNTIKIAIKENKELEDDTWMDLVKKIKTINEDLEIKLPTIWDTDKLVPEMKNGLLTITVQKAQKEEPKAKTFKIL